VLMTVADEYAHAMEAESLFLLACNYHRAEVARPQHQCVPYDFIVRFDGRATWDEVQVKRGYWAKGYQGRSDYLLGRLDHNTKRGSDKSKRKYNEDEFKFFSFCDCKNLVVWLIPIIALKHHKARISLSSPRWREFIWWQKEGLEK